MQVRTSDADDMKEIPKQEQAMAKELDIREERTGDGDCGGFALESG
jgi:hypothetical protein